MHDPNNSPGSIILGWLSVGGLVLISYMLCELHFRWEQRREARRDLDTL